MAPKNNFNDLFSISGNFLSQLLFALFLTLIFRISGQELALSMFLGVLGGVTLGWLTAANKTGPQAPTVASSEGVDAGLRYWLLFLLLFQFLGYSPQNSILLGALAGLGGGWIVAWWGSKEELNTQLPTEDADGSEDDITGERTTKRIRRPTTRYRRRRGNANFRFWQR